MATFEVIKYTNTPGDDFTRAAESTDGIVVFEPPFALGEAFSKVALGREGHGMFLEHVGSTEEATVLRIKANTYRGDESSRRAAIEQVGERVVKFIEDPRSAGELIGQNPFPEPHVHHW